MSRSLAVGNDAWSVRFVKTRLCDLSTGAWSPVGADTGGSLSAYRGGAAVEGLEHGRPSGPGESREELH